VLAFYTVDVGRLDADWLQRVSCRTLIGWSLQRVTSLGRAVAAKVLLLGALFVACYSWNMVSVKCDNDFDDNDGLITVNPSAPALWHAFISVLRCTIDLYVPKFCNVSYHKGSLRIPKGMRNVLPKNGVCGANFASVIMILLLVTNTRNVYLTSATSLNNITYKLRKP